MHQVGKKIRPSYDETSENDKWTEKNACKKHKFCITSHITVAKFVFFSITLNSEQQNITMTWHDLGGYRKVK